jgi:hypothetical protein
MIIKDEIYKAFKDVGWDIFLYETVDAGFGPTDRIGFTTDTCKQPHWFGFRAAEYPGIEVIMGYVASRILDMHKEHR